MRPEFETLEAKALLSGIFHHAPPIHHALLAHPALVVHHAPLVHHAAHLHHAPLVHHAALARPLQTTGGFGGGTVDTTIPFILSTDVGAAQNALNFTSNTYQNVLFGSGGWDGIQQIVQRFGDTGDTNQLAADLNALSFRMPYGNAQLLPTWLADLQSLQNGTLTLTPSGIVWDHDSSAANAVGDVLFADLQTYLAAGLGTNFNILKSQIAWSTDSMLTYNGTVAANGSSDTTVPIGG